MWIGEIHRDVISWMYTISVWPTTMGTNGRQSRKQGDTTIIDSLRSKTHRVIQAIAQEHLTGKGGHV